MSYYLIDFENVKSRGMEGVELLTEEDTVCIFYSDNADSMTFDLHRKLNETKAKIIYHKVAVGTKNALDFQLATYLGYLICEQQKDDIHPNYFIVTKDNGFTSLMVYWKAQGVPVRIIRNLLWGKNQMAGQNPLTEEAEQETEQNLSVEEEQETGEQWIAVAVEEPEAEKPAVEETETTATEEDSEILPAEIPESAQAKSSTEPENPADTVSQDTPVETVDEPAKKPTRKKSNNTRKKSAAKTTDKKTADKKTVEKKTAEEPDELTREVGKVLEDQTIVPQVVKFIRQYKTKQGINNALNKEFKDSKRTSEIYSAIKPLIADKKGK